MSKCNKFDDISTILLVFEVRRVARGKVLQQGFVLLNVVFGQVFSPLPRLEDHPVDAVETGVVVPDQFLTWRQK